MSPSPSSKHAGNTGEFYPEPMFHLTYDPEARRIDTEYIDGPFSHMRSTWVFREAGEGCEVKFDVDFEFRNKLLQRAAGLFFYEAMQRIVRAFEARAAALHGDG